MLSNKQEEYVVERVKKYNEEIDVQRKSVSTRIFRVGMGAIGAVLMTTKAQAWGMSDWTSVPILAGSIYFAVHNAGHLISNIVARVGIAIRMKELVDQAQLMDYADQDAEKGNGKGK